MYKDGTLQLSKWYQGMVKHPIMGFGLIENAEVFENKGLVVPKKGLATTSLTADGLPLAYELDQYGNFYYATATTVYKNTSSLGVLITGLTLVRDIKVYKNYLWVRYGANIGAYGPLDSGSATWFPALITTFNANYAGQLVVGQDDFLYTTNGNFITKMSVTPASVGTPPTITISTSLDLPDGQYTTCITEYGTKIAVGTDKGRVYTWNRQAGTLGNPGLADLPVVFNENAIYQLYSYQNRLYVTAGRNGNLYISDGTNYRKLATIPFTEQFVTGGGQTAYIQPQVTYNPNAITISPKGNLLVGNVSTNTVAEAGVWEISDSGEVILAYKLATGKTSSSSIGIGFLNVNPSSGDLRVGWFNGASDGIDEDTNNFANVTIESPLIRVGTYNKKKSFEHIEWTLADTLASGDSITISYRKNTSETYTEINTWTFASLGAIASFEDIAGIADCEFIQLKLETQGAVNLIDLTLR